MDLVAVKAALPSLSLSSIHCNHDNGGNDCANDCTYQSPNMVMELESSTKPPTASEMPRETKDEVRLEIGMDRFVMPANGVEMEKPIENVPGITMIEEAQRLWGNGGWWAVVFGLASIMIVYEIDNSTVSIYNNFAISSFNALSTLASLTTAQTLVSAVIKPPIAQLSNVIGRGWTYVLAIAFYVLSHILMAIAHNVNTYAAGIVLYAVGQSGTNILNDIVVADITTARWRGLALGLSFFPFLVIPWMSAFITQAVTAPGGIGWRWGVGMMCILMPFGASWLVGTLMYFQRRARKLVVKVDGAVDEGHPRWPSLCRFASYIDLGGVVLFAAGFALLLIPLTLAGTAPQQWHTPWMIALIVVGGVLLIALAFYETYIPAHPILPPAYLRNATIVLCSLLILTDSIGFQVTHTYLVSWAEVARGMSTRDATFYFYTNGVTQCLSGVLGGLYLAWIRRYKHLAVAGAGLRLVGYGVMLRIRRPNTSYAELFIVQLVQGVGSGWIQNSLIVPVQVCVRRAEMAPATAMLVCFAFVGSSIGSCIAGGIYTSAFQPALWRRLGDLATTRLVNALFESITTKQLPAARTAEREAVDYAYSEVMIYMVYVAIGTAALGVLMAVFMPNWKLPRTKKSLHDL